MKLITHHLNKEIASTLLAVTAILVALFLSNQFVRYLAKAAQGRLASEFIVRLILIQLPQLTTLLLPLALFLAILLVYGRWYVDNEATVLRACGVSTLQLFTWTLPVSLSVFFFTASYTLFWGPPIAGWRNQLLSEAASASLAQTILPGRFQADPEGKTVFYVDEMQRDRAKMNTIFMAELSSPTPQGETHWIVAMAKEGYQTINSSTGEPIITALEGTRYDGVPGEPAFTVLHFKKYINYLNMAIVPPKNPVDAYSTAKLLQFASTDHRMAAELGWRTAIPLSVLILTLLAIPLSRVQPRQGRYARLLPSIVLYTLYANFLIVMEALAARGSIHAFYGFSIIHLSALAVATYYWLEKRNA